MDDRQRFIANVLGEDPDRPCYYLYWPPWNTTMKKWIQGGFFPNNKEQDKLSFLHDEIYPIFKPDTPPKILPLNCGPYPEFEEKIIEEDKNYTIHMDSWGIKRRDYKNRESMSEFLEFPVKNRDDWDRYKKERLNPDDAGRLDGNWKTLGGEWIKAGYPIQLGSYPDVGVFGGLRWLLGDEESLVSFYTQPDLVFDIMEHLTTVYLAVFSKVVKEVRVDVLHIWEDISSRNGPLISPDHWKQYMGPNYKRIKQFAAENNIRIISVDTDGNPDLIISPMMEAGVILIFPMEVAAGSDVNLFMRKYPDLSMMGGIDKRALSLGKKEIDSELDRIKPALSKGKYIPTLDHLIPDNVSWENYAYYARRLKELCQG